MPTSGREAMLFDGVLVVNKPAGPTSHDIVHAIRRNFGFGKVGHGGTLDPQATGILVILIGRATKLSDRFIGSDKTYEGVMHLGVETDSQDSDGRVIREADATSITAGDIQEAINTLKGDIYQTPPMTSAVKVGGVPLYKLARKGREIERKPKLIHVYESRLLEFNPPRASFVVRCTKGTYVRTLCYDAGRHLKCGAYLESLCRTASGSFRISQAVDFQEVMKMDIQQLRTIMIPIAALAAAGKTPQ